MDNYFEFCREKFFEIKERLNLKKDKNSSGLTYMAQISTERDDVTPTYWFQLDGVGSLLRPITFSNKDESKIREMIEKFTEDIDLDFVEVAYLETMADRAEKLAAQYRKHAEDNKHRVALEGKTRIKDVRKAMK